MQTQTGPPTTNCAEHLQPGPAAHWTFLTAALYHGFRGPLPAPLWSEELLLLECARLLEGPPLAGGGGDAIRWPSPGGAMRARYTGIAMDAGCSGVAVVSALFDRPDVAVACRAVLSVPPLFPRLASPILHPRHCHVECMAGQHTGARESAKAVHATLPGACHRGQWWGGPAHWWRPGG